MVMPPWFFAGLVVPFGNEALTARETATFPFPGAGGVPRVTMVTDTSSVSKGKHILLWGVLSLQDPLLHRAEGLGCHWIN